LRLEKSGCFNPDDPAHGDPLDARNKVNDTPIPFSPSRFESREEVDAAVQRHRDEIDPPIKLSPEILIDEETLELVGWKLNAILDFILNSLDDSNDPRSRLQADLIRIVLGIGNPPTQAELGRRFNLTRASVSDRCVALQTKLDVDGSPFMRNETQVRRIRASRIISAALYERKRQGGGQGIFLEGTKRHAQVGDSRKILVKNPQKPIDNRGRSGNPGLRQGNPRSDGRPNGKTLNKTRRPKK